MRPKDAQSGAGGAGAAGGRAARGAAAEGRSTAASEQTRMADRRTATDAHAEKRCRGAGAASAEAAIASGTAADTRRSVELKVDCGCKRDVWAEWSAICP